MKELKEKAQALIDKYTPELSSKGLKILLSKRYFESEVVERIGATGTGAIFNSIEKAHDRKKEKHKYKYERNKYHTFIITVVPNEKSVLSHKCCRDYAFVLKKVERVHIGEEPRHVAYEEEAHIENAKKGRTVIRTKNLQGYVLRCNSIYYESEIWVQEAFLR